MARASAIRWRWPPESWRGRRSQQVAHLERVGDPRDGRRRAASGRPCASSAGRRCSPPPSCAGRARSSGRPSRRRGRAAGCASRRARRCRRGPRSGAPGPATIRSAVVLPQPDGPSSTTNSPSATRRSRSSSDARRRRTASDARQDHLTHCAHPRASAGPGPVVPARRAGRAAGAGVATCRCSRTASEQQLRGDARPTRSASVRTVVSSMRGWAASGMSSKPTTDTSCGTRSPARSQPVHLLDRDGVVVRDDRRSGRPRAPTTVDVAGAAPPPRTPSLAPLARRPRRALAGERDPAVAEAREVLDDLRHRPCRRRCRRSRGARRAAREAADDRDPARRAAAGARASPG